MTPLAAPYTHLSAAERTENIISSDCRVSLRKLSPCHSQCVRQASCCFNTYFSVHLNVLSVLIAQWENESHCPPRGLGSIPSHGGIFQGIFPWLITLCQPIMGRRGRKWLNLPSMAPRNLGTSRRKAEVQPWIDDG